LIQSLTSTHGVCFVGTADELKEVPSTAQFVVFDDFDFSDLSVDDIKRLFDREKETQRVKVRYHDALFTKFITRVVLCNAIPEQFTDSAVADR